MCCGEAPPQMILASSPSRKDQNFLWILLCLGTYDVTHIAVMVLPDRSLAQRLKMPISVLVALVSGRFGFVECSTLLPSQTSGSCVYPGIGVPGASKLMWYMSVH